MFGDLAGMQEQQKQLEEKLNAIEIIEESADKNVSVKINANSTILDVQINEGFLKDADKEQLEDILVLTLNDAISRAQAKQAEESQKLIQDMLPPGMGGMFGM